MGKGEQPVILLLTQLFSNLLSFNVKRILLALVMVIFNFGPYISSNQTIIAYSLWM